MEKVKHDCRYLEKEGTQKAEEVLEESQKLKM